MATHRIEQGQTLADVALINFGYLESLANIATLVINYIAV